MFKIDKYVPLPTPWDDYTSYPLRSMEVGDSFYVDCTDDDDAGHRVRAAASYYKRTYGTEFTVRRINDHGYRVWRVR